MKKKQKRIENMETWDFCGNYFGWFALFAILLIFFLGALQEKYQYQSTLVQNFSQSCEVAMKVLYYKTGGGNSKWLWLAPIIIIISSYWFITDFIKWFKWKNKKFKWKHKRNLQHEIK